MRHIFNLLGLIETRKSEEFHIHNQSELAQDVEKRDSLYHQYFFDVEKSTQNMNYAGIRGIRKAPKRFQSHFRYASKQLGRVSGLKITHSLHVIDPIKAMHDGIPFQVLEEDTRHMRVHGWGEKTAGVSEMVLQISA